MDAKLKISRAVITLVTHYAFYGSCALKLKIREDANTNTMSTDGHSIFWGRAAVDEWDQEEVMAVIAHEVLHVVLLHHLRLGPERSAKKWNISTDLTINPILKAAGFKLPKGVLFDEKYKQWNSEKVYADIEESLYEDPEWGYVTEMTGDDGQPLTGDAKQKAIDGVNEMIAQAAANAKKAGQDLHGAIEELVKNIRKPQIDWVSWLRTTVMSKGSTDASWNRPNRKMLSALDVYSPSMVDNFCGPLAFILDTSASVTTEEKQVFLAELQSINQSMEPESMHIICVDTNVAKCYSFTPDDDISELVLTGGGGTDMTPGFNYVRDCLPEVDMILCFSDCEFSEWPKEPELPVVWLSTGCDNNPYGTLIPVNFK
jgi:predicted metal-dependent peptidase